MTESRGVCCEPRYANGSDNIVRGNRAMSWNRSGKRQTVKKARSSRVVDREAPFAI